MFIYLILFITHLLAYQQYSLKLNEAQVIQEFDNDGYIYWYNLTQTTDLCHVVPQYISHNILFQAKIVNYDEQYFSTNFIEGHFSGQINSVIHMLKTNQSLIVFTDNAKIYFYQGANCDLIYQLNSSSALIQPKIIHLKPHQLCIFSDHQIITISYGLLSQYIVVISEQVEYIDIYSGNIKQIEVAQNWIYILNQDNSLILYDYQIKINKIISENVLQFQITDFQDFSHSIAILYANKSINQLLFIPPQYIVQNTTFMPFQQNDQIYYFKQYQSYLLTVQQLENGKSVVNTHILNRDGWRLLNSQVQHNKIQNIIINSDFALIISQESNSILRYTLNQTIVNKQSFKLKDQFHIPAIINGFFDVNDSSILYLHTQTQFLIIKQQENKFKLICQTQYSQLTQQIVNLDIAFSKDQEKTQIKNYQYLITILYPILTQESEQNIIIIVSVVTLFVLLFGFYIFKEYKRLKQYKFKFKQFSESQKQVTTNNTMNDSSLQINCEEK